jgi:pyridinium-3,5-bisthiocarboxylic acid mononucleotide nickel chelatase
MRVAYFDCFSGATGEMALSALVDAGADLDTIGGMLSGLPISPFELRAERVELRGLTATRVHVESGPQEVIRTYASIRSILDAADLPDEPRRTAHRIYRLLAEAAARVEEKETDLVTFHEWGPLDCVVEIVGTALALDMLTVERVFASPIPTGLGMARTEHGVVPIPSPVVLEILQGVPTYSRGVPADLVTPPGAAILAAIAEGYGDMPLMRSDRVGYGAGHLRLDFPNALRVVLGEEQRAGGAGAGPADRARDVLVEAAFEQTELETADRIMDRLVDAGARDAWVTTGMGRGGRPRTTISAVAPGARRDELVEVLRREAGVGEVLVLSLESEVP